MIYFILIKRTCGIKRDYISIYRIDWVRGAIFLSNKIFKCFICDLCETLEKFICKTYSNLFIFEGIWLIVPCKIYSEKYEIRCDNIPIQQLQMTWIALEIQYLSSLLWAKQSISLNMISFSDLLNSSFKIIMIMLLMTL